MINQKQILEYLSENRDRFLKEYHITGIGIFGSFARGDQKVGSDIDLIVEFKNNTPNLYEIKRRLKNEIQNKFNLSVDICRKKYIKPIFKKQILSEVKYA